MEKEKTNGTSDQKTHEGAKFYPDVERNRKERGKTIIMAIILIFMMGGMGITLFIGGRIYSENGTITFIMAALMIVVLVFAASMIPSAFKQNPVKNEPIIEITPREAKINGETYKISDILEVRLTMSFEPVGNKEENEKFMQSLVDKEPEKGVTANVDVAVRDKGDKSKTLYTTVKNSYEALLAFYNAGVKRYGIVYSMKKIMKKSTFDLGNSETKDGIKLSQVSKKDRKKQLY